MAAGDSSRDYGKTLPRREVNVTKLQTLDYQNVMANNGSLFVGPIRFMQYRVKPTQCKRPYKFKHATVEDENCYPLTYDPSTMDTGNVPEPASNGAEWAVFTSDEKDGSVYFESLVGAFGSYPPTEGYRLDFYPFDMTK